MNTLYKKIIFKFVILRSLFLKRRFKKIGEKNKIFGKKITVIGDNVILGNNCSVNNYVTLRCGQKSIQIGDYVTISDFVYITTAGLNKDEFFRHKKKHTDKDVVIGDWVWLGVRSIILPGVRIGNNVIVAAGSVVSKNIPDNSIVAGVPAKIIKSY